MDKSYIELLKYVSSVINNKISGKEYILLHEDNKIYSVGDKYGFLNNHLYRVDSENNNKIDYINRKDYSIVYKFNIDIILDLLIDEYDIISLIPMSEFHDSQKYYYIIIKDKSFGRIETYTFRNEYDIEDYYKQNIIHLLMRLYIVENENN